MWSFVNSRVRHKLGILIGAVVAFTSLCTVELGAQILFAQPDTAPNFASYQYLEECEVVALRLADELEARKNPVWTDTMEMVHQRNSWIAHATSRRPETAVQSTSACLHRFNPDTVHIRNLPSASFVLEVLLMAHRDQDAQRFAQRVLDSVRQNPEWQLYNAFARLIEVFGTAIPARLDDAKRYYAQQLAVLKDDSLYRTVYAAYAMAEVAGRAGDTVGETEATWHAIRTLDAIPAEVRRKYFTQRFLGMLVNRLRKMTKEEGLDSLAISTAAYKSWEANVVQARIFGDDERKTPEEVDLSKVSDLVGEHYYVASEAPSNAITPNATSPNATIPNATIPNAASSGLAVYTPRGAVPRSEIPVRGHVNLIYGLPSYCHAEGEARWIETPKVRDISAWQCYPVYAMLRRLKHRFPELEITILSSTYGTVGELGPLKPADEADTLAKFWLGWHHIPARLVVEERPFFHVPEPDSRRVDLPTPYSNTLHREITFPLMFLTDQDGVQINFLNVVRNMIESEENMYLLETLMRRGRK